MYKTSLANVLGDFLSGNFFTSLGFTASCLTVKKVHHEIHKAPTKDVSDPVSLVTHLYEDNVQILDRYKKLLLTL